MAIQSITESIPSALDCIEEPKQESRLSELMDTLIQQKEELRDQAIQERKGKRLPSEIVLVGGDFFTMGYLGIQSAELLSPSLAATAAFSWMNLIFGEIAGAINVGVSLVCLAEGFQAYANRDYKLAARLFVDFATLFTIGVVMILSSLSIKVSALGALGAFFTTNPWVLPLVFFLMSFPTCLEVSKRVYDIWKNQNIGSELADPQKMAERHFRPLAICGEDILKKKLSEKMEEFQADMGVDAAIETFKLMLKILQKEAHEKELENAISKVNSWNRAQYVRLFQQALYSSAFALGMGNLGAANQGVTAVQNIAMTGANAIPLYMDAFWPFKRNTPIVVPNIKP